MLKAQKHALCQHVIPLELKLNFSIGLVIETLFYRLVSENLQLHQVLGNIPAAGASRGLLILLRESFDQRLEFPGGDFMIANGDDDGARVDLWRCLRRRRGRGAEGRDLSG